jgi:hypothetical protein
LEKQPVADEGVESDEEELDLEAFLSTADEELLKQAKAYGVSL